MSERFFNLYEFNHMDSQSMDSTVDFVDVTLLQKVAASPKGTHFQNVWMYLSGEWKGKFHFINWKYDRLQRSFVPNETSFVIDSEELLSFNVWGT